MNWTDKIQAQSADTAEEIKTYRRDDQRFSAEDKRVIRKLIHEFSLRHIRPTEAFTQEELDETTDVELRAVRTIFLGILKYRTVETMEQFHAKCDEALLALVVEGKLPGFAREARRLHCAYIGDQLIDFIRDPFEKLRQAENGQTP